MQQDPRVAPLLDLLRAQPRAVAVEAAYFLGIAMSHLLTRARLLDRMGAEEAVPYRKPALDLAMEMVSAIERIEGAEIAKLSLKTRMAYASQLAELIFDTGDTDRANAAHVDAALRELQATI
jgi:hypothetical protein